MTRIALWLAQYQLKSKKPALRLRALRRMRHAINNAVVALDEKITIALLDHTLADPEVEIRKESAGILGDMRDVRTLASLIRATNDASDSVQEVAIKGLNKLADKAAIAPLVPKLSHGSTAIKWHVAQTLKALGWRPKTKTEEMNFCIALGDIKQLVNFGSDAVKPLLALLRTEASDKKVAAINVLGEIADPESFKPLQNALRDADCAHGGGLRAGAGRLLRGGAGFGRRAQGQRPQCEACRRAGARRVGRCAGRGAADQAARRSGLGNPPRGAGIARQAGRHARFSLGCQASG